MNQQEIKEKLDRLKGPRPDDGDLYDQIATVAQRMTAGMHQPDSLLALLSAAVLDLHARLGKR